jgi:hypothetical protein
MAQGTSDELLDFVAKLTRERWAESRKPLLASFVPPILLAHGMNYREILGPMTKLVSYLTQNGGGRFKIVIHPQHKAKIGLIPPTENYDFEIEPREPEPNKTNLLPSKSRSQKFVVLNFLEALSTLEPSELDKVQIPVSVLAKLLSIK